MQFKVEAPDTRNPREEERVWDGEGGWDWNT